MSLIVLEVLSHKSRVFVVGPSSGERYASWVVDVESRISGNTTRSSYALWDAKSLVNIDELPYLVMYEKDVCFNVDVFEENLSQNKLWI
jgi:hypothetical protein